MVVTDGQLFQLLKSTDLLRKFAQLICVQHQDSQIDEIAEFRRHTIQMEVYARLPLRAQIQNLHTIAGWNSMDFIWHVK